MPDPNLNAELDKLCRTEVAAGFRSDSDIFDLVVASFCGSGSQEEIRSRTEASLALAAAEHAAAETHFPETTDCDRLDRAFDALESQGILARHNYWCCNNCATEAIRSELDHRPDAIG